MMYPDGWAGKIECLHEGVVFFHAAIQGSVTAGEKELSSLGEVESELFLRSSKQVSRASRLDVRLVGREESRPCSRSYLTRKPRPVGGELHSNTLGGDHEGGSIPGVRSADALIVPALFFGYGLYQFLYVRQLPDSEINLVLIKPVFFLMMASTLCILVRNIKIERNIRQRRRELLC